MINGISVAYIHTPNKELADWYEKTLGLKNDKSKTIFDVGPALVATFEDPDGNFVQISQDKKW